MLELYNGELYVVPSPSVEHQEIASELNMQFRMSVKQRGLGRVFSAPIDVVFSDEDAVIPDLIYISEDNSGIITETAIVGVPDLILEITSNNRKHDLVDKKELYERCAVREYWIVDRQERLVYVYLLSGGRYEPVKEYPFTKPIPVKAIVDLHINLTDYA